MFTCRIAFRYGTELEQVVHRYQRLCRSDWPRGFGSVNSNPHSWIFTSASVGCSHLSNLRSGVIIFFFASLAREGKKITPSSRERHKGIIGRGHDLRLSSFLLIDFRYGPNTYHVHTAQSLAQDLSDFLTRGATLLRVFWDQRGAASLRCQKSHRNHRCYVWTDALSGMVFMSVQKLSVA